MALRLSFNGQQYTATTAADASVVSFNASGPLIRMTDVVYHVPESEGVVQVGVLNVSVQVAASFGGNSGAFYTNVFHPSLGFNT
jgi:hypothetical protein